jgi:hypothetical protein
MISNLQGEGTSFHEGGSYFISRQNGSQLGTHLLIDANETEVDKKNPKFLTVMSHSHSDAKYNISSPPGMDVPSPFFLVGHFKFLDAILDPQHW